MQPTNDSGDHIRPGCCAAWGLIKTLIIFEEQKTEKKEGDVAMIDITPSIEALKNNLIDAETNTTSVQNETNRKKIVLDAFKQISEFFSNHN